MVLPVNGMKQLMLKVIMRENKKKKESNARAWSNIVLHFTLVVQKSSITTFCTTCK
jgi:hypothetical protein